MTDGPRRIASYAGAPRHVRAKIKLMGTFVATPDAPVGLALRAAMARSQGCLTTGVIVGAVADEFRVSVADLTGKSQARYITGARQLGFFVCRDKLRSHLAAIATAFGRTDHTTVWHGINKHAARRTTDREMSAHEEAVLEAIGKAKRMYDPACEDLARHFLPTGAPEHLYPALAQAIQDAVEEWTRERIETIKSSLEMPVKKPS